MKRYGLTAAAAVFYAVMLIWKLSGGVRGSELLYSLLGLYFIPCAIMLIAGAGFLRNKSCLIPAAIVLCGQILLPLFVFRNFQPAPPIAAAAAFAAGLLAGVLINKVRNRR